MASVNSQGQLSPWCQNVLNIVAIEMALAIFFSLSRFWQTTEKYLNTYPDICLGLSSKLAFKPIAKFLFIALNFERRCIMLQ